MLPTLLYPVICTTQGRMRSEMEQFQDLDRIRREFDTTQVTNRSLTCYFVVFLQSLFLCLNIPRIFILFLFCCVTLQLFSPHNKTLIIFESFTVQNKLQELKQGYMKRRDTMRQQV